MGPAFPIQDEQGGREVVVVQWFEQEWRGEARE